LEAVGENRRGGEIDVLFRELSEEFERMEIHHDDAVDAGGLEILATNKPLIGSPSSMMRSCRA
jgi:hypothetical protein